MTHRNQSKNELNALMIFKDYLKVKRVPRFGSVRINFIEGSIHDIVLEDRIRPSSLEEGNKTNSTH